MRRLERAQGVVSVGTFTTFLTAPASHKYEVVQISPNTFGGAATALYVARNLVGHGTYFTDHLPIAAGEFDHTKSYNALVLYAGDALLLGFIGGAAGGEAAVVDYVDVTF